MVKKDMELTNLQADNFTNVYDHCADVLEWLPEAAKIAIAKKTDWEQKLDYHSEGIIHYYWDDDRWASFQTHFLYLVDQGTLKLGIYVTYPCGDSEWSGDITDDYCAVNTEVFPEWEKSRQDQEFTASQESIKEYEEWAEDNGKDPLDHFITDADSDDRFAVSVEIWKINNRLKHKQDLDENSEEYWTMFKQRFPEGFQTSTRNGNVVYDYKLKYHCDRPMTFECGYEPPNDYARYRCDVCGEVFETEDDDYSIRQSDGRQDDD
jgi:hypothetical protein